ncbi:hypothetical protein ABES03_10825 [Neobacillus rhizosphaerae]|uniref:hypothetical protein n=1 Tax=Neobacillus rhizosphaerae TaxID=2880965 RepID=UPI003D2C0F4E
MKKLTKGALTMVLAGAVTFSVTNALLATPPAKQLKEKIASTITGDRKITDVTKEKTVEVQTPTTNVKDRQTKISHNIDSFQVALKNRNKSDRFIAANQPNTKESITNPAKANATTTTTPAAPTIPATSTKTTTPTNTSMTPTSTTTPTTTGANTPSTTTPSNYGQEVSQAAKEKAASRQDKKENNGKKM